MLLVFNSHINRLYFADHGRRGEKAKDHLRQARSLQCSASTREKYYCQVAESIHSGENEKVVELYETICRMWPQDLLCLKLLSEVYFYLGDSKSMLRYLSTTISIIILKIQKKPIFKYNF